MQLPDIYVFPLDTPNQKVVDLKQLLAAQKSITMLEEEIRTTEYGSGYQRMLSQRATECRALVAKLKEKYKGAE